MPQNRATIYSNGIADFQRVIKVSNESAQRVEIPFRRSHLADVLASLTIAGDVKITSPPSFQPANQTDGNIVIDRDHALQKLILQLIGAEVEFEFEGEKQTGQLLGIHEQQSPSPGEPFKTMHLVVQSQDGLSHFDLQKVERLKFVESEIQVEIQKALNRRLRDIKPNSTFVEFELTTGKKSADALIQYTIPAAAWKISYRLILDDEEDFELQGHVVVDNNTDEDWNDFIVAVVMGQPVTFSTDLADTKTPFRSHVNVVQESAVGSVEIEEVLKRRKSSEDSLEDKMYAVSPESHLSAFAPKMAREKSATFDAGNISDTEDYCEFESPHPVSIAARNSAVLPMFQIDLKGSRQVLHYKRENHSQRPFKTVLLHNASGHSLARGVCTVYDQTVYAGSCILPTTHVGGEAMLAHALETGVKVLAESKPIESRRLGIRITDGVAIVSFHKLKRTEYHIANQRSKPFKFLLDHTTTINSANVVCHVESDDDAASEPAELSPLESGNRVEFDLANEQSLLVSFVETTVSKSQVRLVGESLADNEFNVPWLTNNIVDANISLTEDPKIKNCVELQRMLDEKRDQIQYTLHQLERLEKRQERLRKNIESVSGDKQRVKWREDLMRADDQMVQLEDEHLPELQKEMQKLRRELFQALRELSIEWSE